MKKIMIVAGTRPEGIKMAPVIKALRAEGCFETKVCITGQHRQMLEQVMDIFSLKADFNLEVMQENQTLTGLSIRIMQELDTLFASYRPDLMLVQGDTTTVTIAALTAFYQHIPVGHVEAGLRSGNPLSPWPEEMNRQIAGRVARFHFAPTREAAANLLAEDIDPDDVFVTGNTVVDALYEAVRIIDDRPGLLAELDQRYPFPSEGRRLIMVTGHRRENFGEGFVNICRALAELAGRGDVELVYPVHLNPNVTGPVHEMLHSSPVIHLIDPLDYLSFIYMMRKAYLVLTDSGGVQEEAPNLGKPVVVMRDNTERPEAVEAGTVVLAGARTDSIVEHVTRLLDSPDCYAAMARAVNPYGDGQAARRIADILRHRLCCGPYPDPSGF